MPRFSPRPDNHAKVRLDRLRRHCRDWCVLALFLLAGCARDGKPLRGVTVSFHPLDGGRQSYDKTDDQGGYNVVYLRDIRGAKVGKHRVTIRSVGGDKPEKEIVPARYSAETILQVATALQAPVILMSGPGEFAPPIWDQDGTESCVGHGFAGALTELCSSQAVVLPAPVSPRGCYFLSRAIDRAATAGPLPTLTDNGAMPNSAARALQIYGVPLEGDNAGDRRAEDPDYTTWLAAHVNDELKLGEFEAEDARRILTDWTAIEDGDPNKVALLVQALAAGFPAVFAMDASVAEFQSYDGSGILSYDGGIPDHMQMVDLYRKNKAGRYEFRQRNSWGRSWGDGGYAWVDQLSIAEATFSMLVPHLL